MRPASASPRRSPPRGDARVPSRGRGIELARVDVEQRAAADHEVRGQGTPGDVGELPALGGGHIGTLYEAGMTRSQARRCDRKGRAVAGKPGPLRSPMPERRIRRWVALECCKRASYASQDDSPAIPESCEEAS